ncbi:MAG TPA: hypothetical protein VNT81_17030, partial [Vicinamibacterales bacterium]|nr:hypothetical protein [Vicinamibacterales bacterium]
MIPSLRREFNAAWSDAKYRDLVRRLETRTGATLGFPISESPCFFPKSLMTSLADTGVALVDQILDNPDSMAAANAAVPERYQGASAEAAPTFVQVDFGLVRDANGTIRPKLVELQAFASLYGFQLAMAEAYRDAFGLPASLTPFLDDLDAASYHELARRAISGDHDPREVVLMEIEPRQQKTWPDFVVTEQMWGVRAVDTAEVLREGRRLYYRRDGQLTQIKRIYNRVIPDELERKRIQLSFGYGDDLEVEWAGHPAWYFRISKFSIPFLRHDCVPDTRFLDGIEMLPADRDRYLLKPLFSFAGGGIIFAPTDAQIAAIPMSERKNYILQERINFTPVIDTPEGPTQAEIRIMYIRDGARLRPALPLLRMGRGKMMGVDHNKGLRWVGA